MHHRNPDAASIGALLEHARTIAVIGLPDDAAAVRAQAAGMTVVMDRCILVECRALHG